MALWRISLVFAAVFFGPASCARLKKSTTQRKLAESALVKSSAPDQNEKQLVSDKLMDQKDKIDEFISEHEANLKKNELSLAHLEANHAQTVKEYETYTDMWIKKLWYSFWEKKKLAELETARDDLRDRILTTKQLIDSIKLAIQNLNDAKDWTHENSQRARAYEENIAQLATQLELSKQDHTVTVASFRAQKALAKENSDSEDEAHKVEMSGLAKDIEEQTRELARLEDGTHDLHVELEKTKNTLQREISKHKQTIQGLEAKIKAADLDIEEATLLRAQAKDINEAKLATLQEQSAALKSNLATEQEALKAGHKDLEQAIQEGNDAIEGLKKKLQSDIAALEERITESHKSMLKQKKVNEEMMLSAQAKFREDIDVKSRQIDDFISAKKESLQELDALRKTHGEVATDAVVSEALHKAKVDLEFKLKLETNVRDTAVDNLRKMDVELARLNSEIDGKSKWYNKAWHHYVTKRLPNLKIDKNFLLIEIGDEKRRKLACEELISQLSTQIESKLGASQLAEVEEVAIEELEKQIIDVQGEKKKGVEANREALRLEKESGDDAIQILKDNVASLRSQKQAVNDELQELVVSKTHDKHHELEIAKAAKQRIIDTHEATVQSLSGVLSVNELDEQEIRSNEQLADEKHAEAVQDLNDLKTNLMDQKHSLEAQQQAKDADLKKFESDQSKHIDDVRASVAEGLEDLKQFKADEEKSHADAKLKLADIQQLKESENQEEIEMLHAQIQSIQESKIAAEADLREIEQGLPNSA
jgi:hypothetical protein